jgi:hypothetical protein
MTEPAVTLSDYALALEGIILLMLLQRADGRSARLRLWLSLFFASASVASLCGGTVHGFFLDKQMLGHAILWRATLLATGLTAVATWAIGAELLVSQRVAHWVRVAAMIQFVLYCVAVLFYTQEFWVAIAMNLPAVVFLLGTLGAAYLREKRRGLFLAAGGLALSLTAALLQQLRVGIHPVYFNHNVLYHVLQALVLYLLFLGSRSLREPQSVH